MRYAPVLLLLIVPLSLHAQTVPLGETVYFDAPATVSPTTGVVTNADSTPTFNVYEEATDTAIINGTSMTLRTGHTGEYRGTFNATSGNGFELGKWYIVKAYATVGGLSGIAITMHFRIVGTETVEGTPVTDVSLWKGATAPAMTGDAYARVGAPVGASLSADTAAIKTVVDQVNTKSADIQTRLPYSVRTATSFQWGMKFVDTMGNPVSGQTPSCTRSIDDPNSFASTTNGASSTTSLGWSEITLSAGDLTGSYYMILRCTATGAQVYETIFKLQTP